jgi:signal peptidase
MSTVSKKTDILGRRLYVIMSGSMEPTIMTKQAIITEEVNDPQVGDVIAFGKDDFITVHRIIKVYTEGDKKLYQTKGDNNNAEDKEVVSKDIIKGKVKYILPGVGETILFLQQHLILLVVAIGALIIIIVIRRLIFQ